jgi:multidrug efflux pump subunit AcrB
MRGQIPKDVRVAAYYDQSLLVRESINSFAIRFLSAIAVGRDPLAFLRNWGTTFVAILVIPVTVLVTFLAMCLRDSASI